MKKNSTAIATGVALTMAAAGGVAYMMSAKGMKSQRRQFKRQAARAANNISHWAEGVSNMLG